MRNRAQQSKTAPPCIEGVFVVSCREHGMIRPRLVARRGVVHESVQSGVGTSGEMSRKSCEGMQGIMIWLGA